MVKREEKNNYHELSIKEKEKMIDIIRTLFMILIFLYLIMFTILRAEEMEYFDTQIDYWEEKSSPKKKAEKKLKPKIKESEFKWGQYLNPEKDEFFREGEYLPPKPFMELVRRPTDKNITMWSKYIDKKNELLARLQLRMEQYLDKNKDKMPKQAINEFKNQVNKVESKISYDTKQYRFRFYLESSCPHCKKMITTIKELQNKGYYVEARMIDKNSRLKLPFPVLQASKEEIKKYKIKSVPFLIVGDLKKKVVYTLNGYQTVKSIFEKISNAI